jgi:hypothetical protein
VLVPENGGAGPPAAVRSPWRSKRRVLLLVLASMAAMALAGVLYRIVRPTPQERVIRDLPVYPGAGEADLPATNANAWATLGNGFANAIVLGYILPAGTSPDDVRRFYGTHMPPSFSRDGASCWARGDARVLLVFPRVAAPRLDVGVATEGAECPRE